jgi:hypothetical protein
MPERSCDNCRHEERPHQVGTCDICVAYSSWDPKKPEPKPEPKLCPLLMLARFIPVKKAPPDEAYCWGKRCAWWDEDGNPEYSQCAVLKINWNLVAAHGGRVPIKKGSVERG